MAEAAGPSRGPESDVAERVATGVALYPAALPVALVVQVLALNGASPFAAGRALIAAAVVGLVIAVAGRLVLGDRHRGGLLAVLLVLLLLSGSEPAVAILAGAGIALMIAERFAMRGARRRIRWSRIGLAASRLTAIVVLAVAILAVQTGLPGMTLRALTHEGPFRSGPARPAPAADAPDIYLLLLDGYGRADALQQVFGYDDRPFLAALESRGFDVATSSRANYALTAQTLTSMVHFKMLDAVPGMAEILDGHGEVPRTYATRRAINDSPAIRLLHERGYETVAVPSGFAAVSLREADRFLDSGELNEFDIGLLRRTAVGSVLDAVAPDLVSSQQRARIRHLFERLEALASEQSPRPRLIVAHVPAPHPPWVFNADGSPRTVTPLDAFYGDTPATTGLSTDELKAGYIGAVEALHDPVLDAIDAIVARSTRPTAIVVFSDHGSWIGADGGDLRLRFLNLFAARLPGGRTPFPDDVTLVNVLPILFDDLFGTHTPTVANAPSYAFRNGDEFDLVEVPNPNEAILTTHRPLDSGN